MGLNNGDEVLFPIRNVLIGAVCTDTKTYIHVDDNFQAYTSKSNGTSVTHDHIAVEEMKVKICNASVLEWFL